MATITPIDDSATASNSGPKITPIEDGASPPKEHGALRESIQPLLNIPKDIGQDFISGVRHTGEGIRNENTHKVGFSKGGLQAAGGVLESAGAPITGTARALVGDPARKLFGTDTTFGRVASRTMEDAASVFGPVAAEQLGVKLSTTLASPDSPIRRLMDNGVQLTLGQLEPKFMKRMEEAAKSVPVLGSFIRAAENRTLDSFNVATANKALAPIGVTLDVKTGREAIQQGQEVLNKAYTGVLDQIPRFVKSPQLDADIAGLKALVNEMPPGQADRFNAILDNRLEKRFGPQGNMDGKTFKQVESELFNLARTAKASADSAERQFGIAIDEVRSSLRSELERQYPVFAKELTDVNHAYALFTNVERAAGRRSTSEGRFTPGDLLQSIKAEDKTARKRAFAAGDKPLQIWAEDAQSVIGNKLPDSGTTERALWDLTAGGGAMALGGPKALGAIGAGSLPYTKTGQRAVNALAKDAPVAPKAAFNALIDPTLGVAATGAKEGENAPGMEHLTGAP